MSQVLLVPAPSGGGQRQISGCCLTSGAIIKGKVDPDLDHHLLRRHHTSRRSALELYNRIVLRLALSLTKMPPKRTAHGLNKSSAPAKTKLEDVQVDAAVKNPSSSALAKRAARGSDSDDSGPTLRRSPRKRVRVDLKESDDDDSSLTSMDPTEASGPVSEDEHAESNDSVPAFRLNLERFGFSHSRPARSATQTPSKLRAEEGNTSASPFSKHEDTVLNLDEKKSKGGAHKALSTSSPSKKPKNASPRKQKPIVMELKTPHATPENWKKQYTLIEEMRAQVEAPVDTMGCASAMTGVGPLKVR